mmetsp:Transcript_13330/g.30334  ORF Transcript_13330/g.30334 Transcript_13330/m.30334 type:complete len:210 (-) Transcript_13330:1384-2013(-)
MMTGVGNDSAIVLSQALHPDIFGLGNVVFVWTVAIFGHDFSHAFECMPNVLELALESVDASVCVFRLHENTRGYENVLQHILIFHLEADDEGFERSLPSICAVGVTCFHLPSREEHSHHAFVEPIHDRATFAAEVNSRQLCWCFTIQCPVRTSNVLRYGGWCRSVSKHLNHKEHHPSRPSEAASTLAVFDPRALLQHIFVIPDLLLVNL